MADNRASCLVFYSERMAVSCGLSTFTPENSPRNTALSGVQWKTSEHSRVKRDVSVQPHVKARLCDSVLPERGANKGDNEAGFTASLRPQEKLA